MGWWLVPASHLSEGGKALGKVTEGVALIVRVPGYFSPSTQAVNGR